MHVNALASIQFIFSAAVHMIIGCAAYAVMIQFVSMWLAVALALVLQYVVSDTVNVLAHNAATTAHSAVLRGFNALRAKVSA